MFENPRIEYSRQMVTFRSAVCKEAWKRSYIVNREGIVNRE
jgi:hypothetical protein